MAEPNVFNFNARPWAPEEDAVLLRHADAASTPWQGCATASVALSRSTKACYQRYVKLKGKAPAGRSAPHLALHRLVRVKGRLGAQDIEQVARATGLHYHAALSTLASLHAKGAIAEPCPGCPDLQARDEEVARLSAEAVRLEQFLQESERKVESLRARVAELEAKLGVGLDPFAEKLTELQEVLALGGKLIFECNLEMKLERKGVFKKPKLDPRTGALVGWLHLAWSNLEWALVDLVTGSAGSPERVRKQQALLNACIEGLMAESLKTSKTLKEVV